MGYRRLAATLAASLLLMWVLGMSMVRTLDHFYLNLSNFWMALVMVSAMGGVMIVGMWGMLRDKRLNGAVLAGFGVLFITALWLGRSEALIGNRQFLESMIPHHSRAILVCQESDLTDPEITALCDQIVRTQLDEINQMKEILKRY